jgi:hypothetical protein
VILRTLASGTTSSIFINGIGNNYADGADNFNARGVTDLDFGARRDGQAGQCLYFADDFNDVIYQACGFTPTAAMVSVGGRVITADGRGLANALVYLTDQTGETRTARTSPFGYYRFEEIPAGETYVVSVRHKRYQFAPQMVAVQEELTGLDFTVQE